MRKIAIAALLILGALELLFPIETGLMFYVFSPQTSRVFASADQRQLYQQIHASVSAKGQTVFYFGIATIVIALLLILAEIRKATVVIPSQETTGVGSGSSGSRPTSQVVSGSADR